MTDEVRRFWESSGRRHRRASTADSRDRRGFKNAYIAQLRDHYMLRELANLPAQAVVADFGCGEGGLTRRLADAGFATVGLDIAAPLLQLAAQQDDGNAPTYVLFDGKTIPLASAAVHALVAYEVMMYLDDAGLAAMLLDIRRVLRTDGLLVLIEQCRSRSRRIAAQHKLQRTRDDLRAALASAGFDLVKTQVCRHGHLPSTYLIRYGAWPPRWWNFAMRMEAMVGRWLGILPGDYADTLFVARPRT